MKAVKLLLMLASFLIMIAILVNYSMINSGGSGNIGVFIELAAMLFIAIAYGIISYKEQRKNK